MNKIAVIGGGASALLASITAKRNNPSVDITIFEKSDRVGKKILASGNGRCNITNRDIGAKNYFGSNPDFVGNRRPRCAVAGRSACIRLHSRR